jgi:predicted phage tail protein
MAATVIQGAGGKGGGSRAAVEEEDSLRSVQVAQVLDLLSEGEVQGLVNGLQSVYLDGVPVENPDGSRNFENVTFAWTPGTQGQAALPGINAVQTEVGVGLVVAAATPVVRTVTDVDVDTVRVTIAVPQLTQLDTATGDLKGTSIEYAIDVQSDGGGWVERVRDTITGKTTSVYKRSKKIALTGGAPYDIRVRRITADSTTSTLSNAFSWDSYTQIQTLRLRYPNSALAALQVSAKQFPRVPVRAYDMLLLRVQVPSNYNPLTRVYTGAWDGTFVTKWTDNPAWVFYAMATSPRWGLGRYVSASQLNKWVLYRIAQYCDGMVPDGYGGTEPRFTCNVYFQTREQAATLIQDLAAVFRAIAFWAGGELHVVQDAPTDPVVHYSPANVIDGVFTYQSASELQRHSVFIVYWNDLSQMGKRVPEVYAVPELVARFGVRELELSPIGLTSRGQALRLAKWAAYSEETEGESVTFRVAADGALALPGQVCEIADPTEAGERMAGRISSATTTRVVIDAPVALAAGESYLLSIQLPDPANGAAYITEQRAVTNGPGATTALDLAAPFSAAPAAQSMWLLQSDQLVATTWRCLAVLEAPGVKDQFELTCIRHEAGKYALIEQGIALERRPISRIRVDVPAPTGLVLQETVYMDGAQPRSRVTASWVPAANGLVHEVSWRQSAGNWTALPLTSAQSLDITGLEAGVLTVSVRSFNGLGNASPAATATITITGKTAAPSTPTGLAAAVGQAGWVVKVNDPTDPDWSAFELRRDGADWDGATGVFKARSTSGLMPHLATGTHTLRARHWAGTRLSAEATLALAIAAPGQPIVEGRVQGNQVVLRWQDCTTTQPLRHYLVRVGATWDDAIAAGSTQATSFLRAESEAGTRRYWVAAVDLGSNEGARGYVEVTTLPSIDEALAELESGLSTLVDEIHDAGTGLDATRALAETAADLAAAAQEIAAASTLLAEGAAQDLSILRIEQDAAGQALLRTTLKQQTDDDAQTQALAVARSELTASVQTVDGRVTAEAAARTALAVQVADDIASARSDLTSSIETVDGRVTAEVADRVALAAQVADDIASARSDLSAGIEEVDGRVTAEVADRTALALQVGDFVAGATSELIAQAIERDGIAQTLMRTSLKQSYDDRKQTRAVVVAETRLSTQLGRVDGRLTATAGNLTQLAAEVGDFRASATEQLEVLADETGYMRAQYVLALTVGGKVAGYQVNNETGSPSTFVILADKFAVALDDEDDGIFAFVVGLINGTPGVGINGNLYIDGSILARHIDVETLSAISANIGTIIAGLLRNESGSTFLDLDADGSELALQIAGDALRITAAGALTLKGDITASRVSVGTSSDATRFFDPAHPAISLQSSAAGVMAYTGNPGAAVVTADELLFKNNDAAWPITRRIRTGVVFFSILATTVVDDQFSLWYRRNGGTWTHLRKVTEPQSGYGGASIGYGLDLTIEANDTIQFGVSPTNEAYTAFDMGKLELKDCTVTVQGRNF